ncbi:Chemotaxis protein [Caenispirillum salinarum AK4]|uniref:Chemotaxis protein n=1 Tax=Caenispirillum salinarum AK4 TaxID=1238182 RepID=K9GPU3_9PROT|nr:protein phosphatase CheZ [Caenispirillum salinarum]EKV26694.1 Chemotaxis protein [Caenispirillum salinarum AK4]
MAATRVDEGLAARLEEIRREKGETIAVAEVAEVVESLLTTMTGDLTADDVQLYKELEGLARYIHAARAEISSINPGEIQSDLLPTAADELDAIVEATEKATNQIMDAAEVLEEVSGDVAPEVADKLSDATTRIYEACTFQDITGQRITKVVRTLKQIEERVDGLVRAFHPAGDDAAAAQPAAEGRAKAAGDTPSDEDLLNGPQSAEDAMKQDDIDALLADFD